MYCIDLFYLFSIFYIMIEDILLLSMIYILLFIINFPSPLSMTHLLFFKCSVFDFDLYSVTSFPTNSYLINFSKKKILSKTYKLFSRQKIKKKSQKNFVLTHFSLSTINF